MDFPSLTDVLAAKQRIRPYLARTPQHAYPALNELVRTQVFVKHENYQPTGAFKVRGGINLFSQMCEEDRRRGVIAASSGNHGQSVAYAARTFGVSARVVVPVDANPGKVAAMQGMGAEVIFHGERFDDARLHCEEIAQREGYRNVHPANEPLIIAGVATYALEMLEDEPGLEVIIVPVGGGSGAAGVCIAPKSIKPSLRVIGVQSEQAPAAFESWRDRRLGGSPNNTWAEGLATAVAFELTQSILWEMLDDFILVSDDEIKQAVALMVERTHSLAEGAGASPLAGALKLKGDLAGKKVGLVCSGGNISPAQLAEALEVSKHRAEMHAVGATTG